ncbi:MAG: hypothetical protein ACAI38_10720 [Myxococcota bacterium]
MTTMVADSHAFKVNAIDIEGVAPPLATIEKLDPALAATLAKRVDTSVYTNAGVPARIFGAHARAALSPNDFARFAAIAEGTERLAIESVGRRAGTVMVLGAAALTMSLTMLGYSELGVGATVALELMVAAGAAGLTRGVRRFHGANSEAIARDMTSTLEQLPSADGK